MIFYNPSQKLKSLGLKKHNAWKLLREGDNNSTVPLDIGNKLIDSLCEANEIGEVVRGDNLSEAEKYGTKFRSDKLYPNILKKQEG